MPPTFLLTDYIYAGSQHTIFNHVPYCTYFIFMIPFLFHINRPLSAVFDDWSPGLSRRFVFGVLLHLVSDRRSYYSRGEIPLDCHTASGVSYLSLLQSTLNQ